MIRAGEWIVMLFVMLASAFLSGITSDGFIHWIFGIVAITSGLILIMITFESLYDIKISYEEHKDDNEK